MEELQNKLIEQLETLISHLNRYEEKNWSAIFQRIRNLIDNGDYRGIDGLNNMRGGMGSFMDLVLCKLNGHKITQREESFANKELLKLGNLVFTTADKLKRIIHQKDI